MKSLTLFSDLVCYTPLNCQICILLFFKVWIYLNSDHSTCELVKCSVTFFKKYVLRFCSKLICHYIFREGADEGIRLSLSYKHSFNWQMYRKKFSSPREYTCSFWLETKNNRAYYRLQEALILIQCSKEITILPVS